MNVLLFDDAARGDFLPLAHTRPVGLLRSGILTQQESWSTILDQRVSFLPHASLRHCFPPQIEEDNLLINARLLAFSAYRQDVIGLQPGEAMQHEGTLIAARCDRSTLDTWINSGMPNALLENAFAWEPSGRPGRTGNADRLYLLETLTDVFALNERAIKSDFRLITHGRISEPIDPTVIVLGDPGDVFIEPGAQVEACFLNTRQGPIYIGNDAVVMEGAVIQGPVAILENATVKPGGRISGGSTIGPHSKVGGEVSNSVIQGFSNKAHDGFLGNSVIGEWCNLGADTNTSNLKNNYSEVSIYHFASRQMRPTGLTFCGLLMGDHSKCGINTMFNTGTVVGVSANIFGGGFPPKYIPSFAWGGASGLDEYERDKAIATAKKVMARRGKELDDAAEQLLRRINDDNLE